MKYKVGDKVRVKSKEWFDRQLKDNVGDVLPIGDGHCFFVSEMFKFCGMEIEISNLYNNSYLIKDDIDDFQFDDWMFEDQSAPKHTTQRRKFSKIGNVIY